MSTDCIQQNTTKVGLVQFAQEKTPFRGVSQVTAQERINLSAWFVCFVCASRLLQLRPQGPGLARRGEWRRGGLRRAHDLLHVLHGEQVVRVQARAAELHHALRHRHADV
jgi:hypothetical protein